MNCLKFVEYDSNSRKIKVKNEVNNSLKVFKNSIESYKNIFKDWKN